MEEASRRGFIGALALSGASLTVTGLNAASEKLDFSSIKKDTDFACLTTAISAIRAAPLKC